MWPLVGFIFRGSQVYAYVEIEKAGHRGAKRRRSLSEGLGQRRRKREARGTHGSPHSTQTWEPDSVFPQIALECQ